MSNNMEKLNKTVETQFNLQMQNNQMLLQQINLNQNMIRGFSVLAEILNKVTQQFAMFGQLIKQTMVTLRFGLTAKSQGIVAAKDAANQKLGKNDVQFLSRIGDIFDSLNNVSQKGKERIDKFLEDTTEVGMPNSLGGMGKKSMGLFEGLSTGLKDAFAKVPLGEMFKTNLGPNLVTPLKDLFGGLKHMFASDPTERKVGAEFAGSGLKGMLQAPFKMMASPLANLGKMMKPMGAEFATMMPQMMALMLIIKPVMALIQGLLEPFEPLIEVFGVMGELLGLIILPITMELSNALLTLIMNGATLIPGLQQMALGFFNLIFPLINAINVMQTEGISLGAAISKVIADALTSLLSGFATFLPAITSILEALVDAMITMLPDILDTIIPEIADAIGDFFVEATISGLLNVADRIRNAFSSFWNWLLGRDDDIWTAADNTGRGSF